MDFQKLQYFLAAAEDKSLTAAANRLFLTQQGLSKAILSLEKELGCDLFVREKKQLLLTPAGEALQKHAKSLCEGYDAMQKEMQHYSKQLSLQLSLLPGGAFSAFEQKLSAFQAENPSVTIQIENLDNEACLDHVYSGKSDIAFAIPHEQRSNFCYLPFPGETVLLILPKSHPLAAKEKIALADLDQLPLAMYAGDASSLFLGNCHQQGIHPQLVCKEPDMLSLYRRCVMQKIPGISLGFLKGKLVFEELVERPIEITQLNWNPMLILSNQNSSPAKQLFLEYFGNA